MELSHPKDFFPAIVWVDLEFLRYVIPLTLPAHLAVTHVNFPAFIQLASITGSSGISFLIVLGSTACYELSRWFFQGRDRDKEVLLGVLLVFLLLDSAVLADALRLNSRTIEGARRPIKFATVQGSITPREYEKADSNPQLLEALEDRYLDLTEKAWLDGAEFIAWPEGVFNVYVMDKPRVRDWLFDLARKGKVSLVVGTPRFDAEAESRNSKYYNTAYLISSEGRIADYYDKKLRVPVIERFVNKGARDSILESPSLKLGVGICFETPLPSYGRNLVREGAEAFLFMNNASDLERSLLAKIHANEAILRAVENRRYTIVAGQSGISMCINPFGQVLSRLELFEKGILHGIVHPIGMKTFYQRWGDFFALSLWLLTLSFLIVPAKVRFRSSSPDSVGERVGLTQDGGVWRK